MHHEETTTFWTLCPADGWMLLRGRPARVKADTKELEPETPTVKTYPARYCVARMDITVDGGMGVTGKKKEEYLACTIKIESDTVAWNYEGRGRIRGRGNSTWEWYPKKPYRIKLDEKAEILGLDANKDWVLLANYRDPTHLMNTFVFEMGQGLGISGRRCIGCLCA